MLTINERMRLKEILKLISDEKGRFLPNHQNRQKSLIRAGSPLESDESDKRTKLIKVKDTYGTYVLKKDGSQTKKKLYCICSLL